MATPKFTKTGAQDLEFPEGLVFPMPLPIEKKQVIVRAAGGGFYVYDKGPEIQQLILLFHNLTAAKYALLKTWWRTTVNGAMNEFTFTDHQGTAYVVTCVSNPLPFQWDHEDGFSGELLLEVTG